MENQGTTVKTINVLNYIFIVIGVILNSLFLAIILFAPILNEIGIIGGNIKNSSGDVASLIFINWIFVFLPTVLIHFVIFILFFVTIYFSIKYKKLSLFVPYLIGLILNIISFVAMALINSILIGQI